MATMALEVPKRAFRRRDLASSAALLLVNLLRTQAQGISDCIAKFARSNYPKRQDSLPPIPLANSRPVCQTTRR